MGYRIREEGTPTRPLPLTPPGPQWTPPAPPAPPRSNPAWGDVLGALVGMGIVFLVGVGITTVILWGLLAPVIGGQP